MTKDYSPFRPGEPVPVEFFVGRTAEVQRLVGAARQATGRRSTERLFVVGERGIGKSSLCSYARAAAERDSRVLSAHVHLGGVDTLEEMLRRVLQRLLSESVEKPWYERVTEFLGNHVRQVGLFGVTVEFTATDKDLSAAVDDLPRVLHTLTERIAPERRGLMLVLDDLNGLAASPRFANWLKSFVDEAATGGYLIPFTLVLIGVPERRLQLVSHQQSLNRVFDVVKIESLNAQETRVFFERAFNSVNAAVDAEALDVLCRFSRGHPSIMHELGDATFRADDDNHISEADALDGVVDGARRIGVRYLEPTVLAALQSEHYKHILAKLAKRPFEHRFTRKETAAALTESEAKVFDNFLRRMERLGVIRKDPERGRGSYEFTSELYHLFFWLHLHGQAAQA